MDSFIADNLQGVSRTYAILIPLLPRPLAEPVGLAYLLMRIVDTVEDAPELSPEQRQAHLDALHRAINGDVAALPADLVAPIGEIAAERELMTAIPEVLRRVEATEPAYRDAIRTCATTMIKGVSQFAARSAARGRPYPAIADAAEMREYCYYVAGVVGEMLCAMMAHYLKLPALLTLHDVAVELGIGLQLVNILKDALKDSRQGRRYLPTPTGSEVSHAQIHRAVLEEARRSLRAGTEFVLALPAQAAALRSFCGLPIAWGALTLVRAERDARRAKIGRNLVRASMDRFEQIAADDQSLRGWFARLLRCPPPLEGRTSDLATGPT